MRNTLTRSAPDPEKEKNQSNQNYAAILYTLMHNLENSNKLKDMVNDATLYDLDICSVQETHDTTQTCKEIKNKKWEKDIFTLISNHLTIFMV